ncbi:MAG: type IV toxin-antitoxin system AbiEi family antitoxin domain-containing protein [Solirubrobacterales bacterium]
MRRQHGVISRRQLTALGYTQKAIEHRLATGRLHPLRRGVYAAGRREVGEKGRWMAAVLACGAGAALSHRSAAALHRIGTERPRERPAAGTKPVIELSVPGSAGARRADLRVHRRPSLPSHDLGSRDGIPVTSPVRTLLDYASLEPPNRVERAVNEADKHDLIDPERLRRALEAYRGQPGVRRLREILDRDTFLLSDQELEVLFRPLAGAAGLPLPSAKVEIDGFEVDFFWPELGLVVETDGWRYHRTPSAQTRDALRFQRHTAAGRTPLRFSHHQVRHEPATSSRSSAPPRRTSDAEPRPS